MTPLRDAVDEYIALRRGLGFKLRDMATGLPEFAAFLEQHAASSITTALAVAWAMQPVDHQPSDWAKRLGFVRVFARHWSATDPRTEIPTAGLLPFRTSSGSAVSSTTSPVGGEQALDPIASWPEDSARGRSRAATELLLE